MKHFSVYLIRTEVMLFLLTLPFVINAQIGNDAIGSRAVAMGGNNVTLSDIWATNNNQAGLGFVDDIIGGIYYENRFLLEEISYKAGAFAMPTKTGAIGLSVSSFGYELYNETKIGLAYGMNFGKQFAAGIQLNYLNTKLAQEYGSNTAVTAALGIITKLTDELTLGVHLYNPTRSKLTNVNNERIPTIMKLGIDYRFSKKVLLAVSTEKSVGFDANVNAGAEYHVTELFYLRGGISTNPQQYAFGVGVQLKHLMVDLSSSFHPTLGVMPTMSIIYSRKKRTKKEL